MIGMKSRARTVLCAHLCLAVALAPMSGFAQTANDSAQASAPSQGATVCLMGTHRAGVGKGRPIGLIVPADKADKYNKRGFVQASCQAVRQQTEAERRQMCELAATGNRAVTLSYWQNFGVTPLEMCRGVSADLGN